MGNITAPNTLSALRPLESLAGSGFGALQRAPKPHCPRPANLQSLNRRFAYSGSGNVADRKPLGEIEKPQYVRVIGQGGRRSALIEFLKLLGCVHIIAQGEPTNRGLSEIIFHALLETAHKILPLHYLATIRWLKNCAIICTLMNCFMVILCAEQ